MLNRGSFLREIDSLYRGEDFADFDGQPMQDFELAHINYTLLHAIFT